jgi:hypothetical protein
MRCPRFCDWGLSLLSERMVMVTHSRVLIIISSPIIRNIKQSAAAGLSMHLADEATLKTHLIWPVATMFQALTWSEMLFLRSRYYCYSLLASSQWHFHPGHCVRGVVEKPALMCRSKDSWLQQDDFSSQ